MKTVPPVDVILNSWKTWLAEHRNCLEMMHTGSLDEVMVSFSCYEWIRQFSQERLQQASRDMNIVIEGFGVPKVNPVWIYRALVSTKREQGRLRITIVKYVS